MQATITTTVTVRDTDEEVLGEQRPPQQQEQLVLRLRPPASPPHVTWAAGTIDNEHMGRLKSNCCCIYTPPRRWDDPSTWEPDEHETEHCRGHTEPKRKKQGDGGGEEEGVDKENEPAEEKACGCDHC